MSPARPAAPAADGTLVLVFRGGADLSFRDGSGTKRRALRGVPFVVDAATAELLLATDPTVGLAELGPATVEDVVPPAPTPAAAASAPQGGSTTPADDPGATVPGEAGTPSLTQPEAPADDMLTGGIRLGDLPPGAVKGRN